MEPTLWNSTSRRREGGWKRILKPRQCGAMLLTGELEPVISTCYHLNMLIIPRNVAPNSVAEHICLWCFQDLFLFCPVRCREKLWSWQVVNSSSEMLHDTTNSNYWSVMRFWNVFWLSGWTLCCLSELFSNYCLFHSLQLLSFHSLQNYMFSH